MSSETKQGWEPSARTVMIARDAYEKSFLRHAGDPHANFSRDLKAAIAAAVAADPLLSAAKDMQDALFALEQAFIAHTQWNGNLPVEVIAARAALRKSRGEG